MAKKGKMRKRKGIEIISHGFGSTTNSEQEMLMNHFDDLFKAYESGDIESSVRSLDSISSVNSSNEQEENRGFNDDLNELFGKIKTKKDDASEELTENSDEPTDEQRELKDEEKSRNVNLFRLNMEEESADDDSYESDEDDDDETDELGEILKTFPLEYNETTTAINMSSHLAQAETIWISKTQAYANNSELVYVPDKTVVMLKDAFIKLITHVVHPIIVLDVNTFREKLITKLNLISQDMFVRLIHNDSDTDGLYVGVAFIDYASLYKAADSIFEEANKRLVLLDVLLAITDKIRAISFMSDDFDTYKSFPSDYVESLINLITDYLDEVGDKPESEDEATLDMYENYMTALVENHQLIMNDVTSESLIDKYVEMIVKVGRSLKAVDAIDQLIKNNKLNNNVEHVVDKPDKNLVEQPNAEQHQIAETTTSEKPVEIQDIDNTDSVGQSVMADAIRQAGIDIRGGNTTGEDEPMHFTPHRKKV